MRLGLNLNSKQLIRHFVGNILTARYQETFGCHFPCLRPNYSCGRSMMAPIWFKNWWRSCVGLFHPRQRHFLLDKQADGFDINLFNYYHRYRWYYKKNSSSWQSIGSTDICSPPLQPLRPTFTPPPPSPPNWSSLSITILHHHHHHTVGIIHIPPPTHTHTNTDCCILRLHPTRDASPTLPCNACPTLSMKFTACQGNFRRERIFTPSSYL